MNAGGTWFVGVVVPRRDDTGEQRVIQRRHRILKIKRAGHGRVKWDEAIYAGLRAQQIHFIQPRRIALHIDRQIIFQRQRNRILQAQH